MESTSVQRRAALRIGCTVHAVQDGMSTTIYLLMPLLAQTFGLGFAMVGLLRGVKDLGQGLPEMLSGLVAERIGEGRTLLVGLVFSGIGYIALGFAPGLWAVIVCFLCIGVGTAFHHAPASALIANSFGAKERRAPLGLYNSAGDVGKLAFTAAFSLALGAGLAWQGISIAFGAVGFIALVVILAALRRAGPGVGGKPPEKAADAKDDGLGWGILNWRTFSTILLVVYIDTAVQAGVLVFVAFLMIEKGFAIAVATTGTLALLVGGIFGKAGCGFLAQRLGAMRAFILIQLASAAGLAALVMLDGWLIYVILVPLGAVVQGSSTITYGFVADMVHPKRMARGFALMYSSSSFSAAGGPLLFGFIADQAGLGTAFYAMAAASVLAVPPLLALRTMPNAR